MDVIVVPVNIEQVFTLAASNVVWIVDVIILNKNRKYNMNLKVSRLRLKYFQKYGGLT